MNFFKNYCSFEKLHQILYTVLHRSVLKKLSCALALPLGMRYSLCLIRKSFSYLFPRKLVKVLSLSFTKNREDMFDLDSSVTRVAIVLINLIGRIVTLFVWFVRSM